MMPISGRSFSGLWGAGAAAASGCSLNLNLQVHTQITAYVHRTSSVFFSRAKTCRPKQLMKLHRSPQCTSFAYLPAPASEQQAAKAAKSNIAYCAVSVIIAALLKTHSVAKK